MSTQRLLGFRCGSCPPVTHFSGGDREQKAIITKWFRNSVLEVCEGYGSTWLWEEDLLNLQIKRPGSELNHLTEVNKFVGGTARIWTEFGFLPRRLPFCLLLGSKMLNPPIVLVSTSSWLLIDITVSVGLFRVALLFCKSLWYQSAAVNGCLFISALGLVKCVSAHIYALHVFLVLFACMEAGKRR